MPYTRISISIKSTDLEHLRTLVKPQGKSVAEYISRLIRADLAVLNASVSFTAVNPMLQIHSMPEGLDISRFGAACRKMGVN